VQSNETIILDSGTTTAEVARHLKIRKLQSIYRDYQRSKTSLQRAHGCPRHFGNHDWRIAPPGIGFFVGPQAETMLKELHADRLFLAVDGFDLEIGPSTPDVFEAQLNGLMMRISKE